MPVARLEQVQQEVEKLRKLAHEASEDRWKLRLDSLLLILDGDRDQLGERKQPADQTWLQFRVVVERERKTLGSPPIRSGLGEAEKMCAREAKVPGTTATYLECRDVYEGPWVPYQPEEGH